MSTKVVVISLSIIVSACIVAPGQTPLRRYSPPGGPTLTPYLDYYRADLSTLPNPYQSFIVPQRQMQRNMYDLARNQQADVRKIESDIKQIRAAAAAPTGVGASFQNYSHYYRFPGGIRQRH